MSLIKQAHEEAAAGAGAAAVTPGLEPQAVQNSREPINAKG